MTRLLTILLLTLLLTDSGQASDDALSTCEVTPKRWLILHARHEWACYDELPFTYIQTMCWNDIEGFCDAEYELGFIRARVIDYETRRYGVVVQTEAGHCYFMMFRPYRGQDGHIHVMDHEWIACEW